MRTIVERSRDLQALEAQVSEHQQAAQVATQQWADTMVACLGIVEGQQVIYTDGSTVHQVGTVRRWCGTTAGGKLRLALVLTTQASAREVLLEGGDAEGVLPLPQPRRYVTQATVDQLVNLMGTAADARTKDYQGQDTVEINGVEWCYATDAAWPLDGDDMVTEVHPDGSTTDNVVIVTGTNRALPQPGRAQ